MALETMHKIIRKKHCYLIHVISIGLNFIFQILNKSASSVDRPVRSWLDEVHYFDHSWLRVYLLLEIEEKKASYFVATKMITDI